MPNLTLFFVSARARFWNNRRVTSAVRPHGIEHKSYNLQVKRSSTFVRMTSAGLETSKKVAVVGAGIAGLVAADKLAGHGCHVAVFDLGRGPGGRMSQRRETVTIQKQEGAPDVPELSAELPTVDLKFDHGAQYFSSGSADVSKFLGRFVLKGTVVEWKGNFGVWDVASKSLEPADPNKTRLICTPGMNAVCQELASSPNIKTTYGTHVAHADWHKDNVRWELTDISSKTLGTFDGLVIAAAYRTFPVNISAPETEDDSNLLSVVEGITDVPAEPCFALMLAFPQPLDFIPFDGAKISGSATIAWVARDSSKPGRHSGAIFSTQVPTTSGVPLPVDSNTPESWVIHSTAAFAKEKMAAAPPGKPSPAFLSDVGQEMLRGFKDMFPGDVHLPTPLFLKVHRWGGAFPSETRAPDGEKFLSGGSLPVVACGDFCLGPRVESAIESALAASDWLAAKLKVHEKVELPPKM